MKFKKNIKISIDDHLAGCNKVREGATRFSAIPQSKVQVVKSDRTWGIRFHV